MSTFADIALVIALVLGISVVVLLAYVLFRRAIDWFRVKRLERRIARVDRIIRSHQKEEFAALDRLLFQLGEVHDLPAVEMALDRSIEALSSGDRLKLQHVFESLGLIERHIHALRHGRRWDERARAAHVLGELHVFQAIPALVEAMRDPYEDGHSVKLAAAQALGRMQAAEAVPFLVRAMRDVDEFASPRIAEVLVSLGEVATDALLEALVDEESVNARVWSAQILGRIEAPAATKALIGRLRDRAERVRMSVAETLGRLKSRSAIHGLVQLALRDPVAPVRSEAARALGQIGDPSAVQSLVALIADPDYWTRLRAIEAIELIRPTDTSCLETSLHDISPEVRGRAALALERVGVLEQRVDDLASQERVTIDRATAFLVEVGRAGLLDTLLALSENTNFQIRSRMASILGEVGDPRAVEALARLTQDALWPVRVRAIEAIGSLRPKEGIHLVLPALADEEEMVRAAAVSAIKALGISPSSPAIKPIVELYNTTNSEVRSSVIETLGHLNHPDIDAILKEALTDPNADVRLRATQSISGHVDRRWLTALKHRLADPRTVVRIAAAQGLGGLGTPDAFRAVAQCLSTPDRSFREALTDVLSHESPSTILSFLPSAPNKEIRLGLIWALGKTNAKDALSELHQLATDPDNDTRAAAAGALAKIDHDASRTLLVFLLKDRNERVRAAAVNALGAVGTEGEIPHLRELLEDPDVFVRCRVPVSLGRIGGDLAQSLLSQAETRDPSVRFQTYVAIGRALCGGSEGFQAALSALAQPGLREKVEKALLRESDVVQSKFRENLNLAEGGISLDLSPANITEHYALTIKGAQDPVVRAKAIDALRLLGPSAHVDLLLDALSTDPSPNVRRLAISVLDTQWKLPQVQSALVQALRDPNAAVQAEAATILGKTGDSKFNLPLLKCFATGDALVDACLVASLCHNNLHRALALADELMGFSERSIKLGGAAVLGALGDPRAAGLLRMWLDDKDSALRAASIKALGELGTAEAKEALLNTVSDPNEIVRLAAAEALAEMPGSDIIEVLVEMIADPSVDVRLQLARSVGKGSRMGFFEIAARLAQDPDEDVRTESLISLLLVGDTASLEHFVEAMAEQPEAVRERLRALPDNHPTVALLQQKIASERRPNARLIALKALAAMDHRPIPVLLTALRDPDARVRKAAIEASAILEVPEIRIAYEALLRDPDKDVRNAVRRLSLEVIESGDSG